MSRVILSNIIKETTGEVVPPYEVDNYPSDWLETIKAYAITYPRRYRDIQKAKHG